MTSNNIYLWVTVLITGLLTDVFSLSWSSSWRTSNKQFLLLHFSLPTKTLSKKKSVILRKVTILYSIPFNCSSWCYIRRVIEIKQVRQQKSPCLRNYFDLFKLTWKPTMSRGRTFDSAPVLPFLFLYLAFSSIICDRRGHFEEQYFLSKGNNVNLPYLFE